MSCCTSWPREADPCLHDFYAKKLLEPGWAGDVDDKEAAYIARELNSSARLRQQWHVKEILRYHRRITPATARRLASWWALRGVEGLATDTTKGRQQQQSRTPSVKATPAPERIGSIG